jgi:hypothetical protein
VFLITVGQTRFRGRKQESSSESEDTVVVQKLNQQPRKEKSEDANR